MSRYSKDNGGTNLSFSPAHDSEDNGPNHVDGQRWHDGEKDITYNKGQSDPQVHGVPQSPGYGNQTIDIPVRSSSTPSTPRSSTPTRDPGEFTDALLRRRR